MWGLLGSLLGFGTGFAPKILGYFETKRDQKHELSIMDKQKELEELQHTNRLEATDIDGQIAAFTAAQRADSRPTGVKFIDGYRASVRPTIAYIYTFLFVAAEIGLYVIALKEGMGAFEATKIIWAPEVQGTYSAIISFYFANRTFGKSNRA